MTSRSSDPGQSDMAWSDNELELLGAARAEHMPAELEARLRQTLDLQLVAAASQSGMQTASTPREATAAARSPAFAPASDAARASSELTAARSRASQPAREAVATHAPASQPARDAVRATREAVAPHAPASQPARDSAHATQWFSLKLPFWGTLCVIAVGSLAYWGSRGEPVTGAGGPVDPQLKAAAPSASSLAAERAGAEQLAALSPAQPLGEVPPTAAYTQQLTAVAAAPEQPSAATLAAAQQPSREAAEPGASQGESLAAAPAAADMQMQPVAAPATAVPDQLRLEAELLERARAALRRGALSEARQLLGRYAREFEHGALQPESDVLVIELQMRVGEQSTAKEHASRFLAAHPNHPLAERVQMLVATRKRR